MRMPMLDAGDLLRELVLVCTRLACEDAGKRGQS